MQKNSDKPVYLADEAVFNSALEKLPELDKKVMVSMRNHGYAFLPDFIDGQLIDSIVKDCNGKYQAKGKHLNQNRRVQDAFTFSDNVKELACHKGILSILKNVYGRNAFPFQTLNFEIGTEQETHSDTIHFCSMPDMFMTGVWVAFENVDDTNGPLHYFENSNKLPVLNTNNFNLGVPQGEDVYENYAEYERLIKQLTIDLKLKKQSVSMKKGDVFIWSANLLHGGSAIKNPSSTRLSQVTHYFYDDCFYFTPLLTDFSNNKIGLRLPHNILTGKRISVSRYLSLGRKFFSPVMLYNNFLRSSFRAFMRKIW